MNLKNLFDRRKNRMSYNDVYPGTAVYPGIAGAAAGNVTSVDWMTQIEKMMAQQSKIADLAAYTTVPPTKNPDKLIHGMSVDKIENGLLVHINLGGVSKSIYVESLDKLGDAIVSAVVANRIEGEKK